ncbi:MAG: 4-hydroxy-tetrahydrodipicolinate reductase [Burkholderiales bacterium]|nr:4-hydroxy-tetrahydrodipicolinate reductase [Burkholderiales bacterium]
MGRALLEAVFACADARLAGALEVAGSPVLGRDAGELVGAPCGIAVSADFEAVIPRGDCLVDFTRPEGTLAHLEACVRAGRRAVIGTTGFDAPHKARIEAAARSIPVVMAPNMAVGVNVLIHLAGLAAGMLGEGYDVEIVEAHHRHKVDAPSGTALKLGEVVARARGLDLRACAVHGRSGVTGERTAATIGFHALRGGDIVGEHTAMFAGPGERVELTVRSASRMTYALGALRACRFLMKAQPGLYGMEDVLGLRA